MLRSYDLQMKWTRKHVTTCAEYPGGEENSDGFTNSQQGHNSCSAAPQLEPGDAHAALPHVSLVPPALQATWWDSHCMCHQWVCVNKYCRKFC